MFVFIKLEFGCSCTFFGEVIHNVRFAAFTSIIPARRQQLDLLVGSLHSSDSYIISDISNNIIL